MKFSESLQSLRAEGSGAFVARTSDDWAHFRTTFGGLQAGLAVRAMRLLLGADTPLRTLQVTFIAPVTPGEVRINARILRSGKSATQVEARIVDGEQTLCLLVGIFGASRPSSIRRIPGQPLVSCERPIEAPFVQGYSPNFTQHFRLRWLRGGPAFTGNPLPSAVIDIAMLDEAAAGEEQVLAIADSIPPVALSMMTQPKPGSSMIWTMEFHGEPGTALPLAGWRLDAELTAARDGYTSQSVHVWGPDGSLVGLSRQNMVVFG